MPREVGRNPPTPIPIKAVNKRMREKRGKGGTTDILISLTIKLRNVLEVAEVW